MLPTPVKTNSMKKPPMRIVQLFPEEEEKILKKFVFVYTLGDLL
jgi:hypothetical protein